MKYLVFVVALGAGWATTEVRGATVFFERISYPVPAILVESSANIPVGTLVNDFLVTSDADILSIGSVSVTGVNLYSTPPPFGRDFAPPDPPFIALTDGRGQINSFVTTPGSTSRLGPPLPGDGTSSYGDLSNDGPQSRHVFARLTTLPGKTGFFNGRVALAGSQGPEYFPFSFPIGVPEPTSVALLGLCLSGVFLGRGFRTRHSAV